MLLYDLEFAPLDLPEEPKWSRFPEEDQTQDLVPRFTGMLCFTKLWRCYNITEGTARSSIMVEKRYVQLAHPKIESQRLLPWAHILGTHPRKGSSLAYEPPDDSQQMHKNLATGSDHLDHVLWTLPLPALVAEIWKRSMRLIPKRLTGITHRPGRPLNPSSLAP